MPTLKLSLEEILELTGGLSQPRRQLDSLRAAGFWRARIVRGQVILERAHYEAVCAGALPAGTAPRDTDRPRVRPAAAGIRKAA